LSRPNLLVDMAVAKSILCHPEGAFFRDRRVSDMQM
jgi:hypothetical protein